MEHCPKCGSTQVEKKNTMMERGFAVCYVDYYECKKCGSVWEPKRMIEVRLSWENWDIPPLNVPDGSTVRITYPDGYTWDAELTYLDPTHFQVNGSTYHMDQFAEMLDRAPGTKVEIVDDVKSKSKKRKPRTKAKTPVRSNSVSSKARKPAKRPGTAKRTNVSHSKGGEEMTSVTTHTIILEALYGEYADKEAEMALEAAIENELNTNTYSRKGGKWTIRTRSTPKQIVDFVEDNGYGFYDVITIDGQDWLTFYDSAVKPIKTPVRSNSVSSKARKPAKTPARSKSKPVSKSRRVR